MASSLQSTLNDILAKLERLEQSHQHLQAHCSDLERRNTELQLEKEDITKALDRSRLEIEYLRVSYRLAGDADSLIEARRKISSIIRRIDKAIALATDDPSL